MRIVVPTIAFLVAMVATAFSPGGSKQAPCGKLLSPAGAVYFGSAPDFVSDPKRLGGDTVTTAGTDR